MRPKPCQQRFFVLQMVFGDRYDRNCFPRDCEDLNTPQEGRSYLVREAAIDELDHRD